MSDFYVYAWLRPCGTPFYIGKGRGKRANALKTSNPIFMRIVEKLRSSSSEPVVVKLFEGLSEDDAFELEKQTIAQYGRLNDRSGILSNLTDGGEGQSGWIPTKETRNKIAAAHTGRRLTPEHRAKIGLSGSGRLVTDLTREKLSKAFKGRVVGEETRAKIADSRRGKPLSEETRRRISVNSGSKSPEARRRMSESRTGLKHSDETRKKIGDANRGKTYNDETRAKIGSSSLGRKHSSKTRELLSELAKNMSTETREKLAAANRKRAPIGLYKGVFLHSATSKWIARITIAKKVKQLGSFSTPEEAAYAYDAAATAAWGRDCYLNFPVSQEVA